MLSKEIKEQKRIINKIKLQYKQQGHTLKESIIEMNEVNGQLALVKEQITSLQKLNKDNDNFRKKFCDEMMVAKLGFESSKNTLIQQETRQTVLEYEADKMRSRLSNLYSSMENLGEGKLLKDQLNAQLIREKETRQKIQVQLQEIQDKLTKEND